MIDLGYILGDLRNAQDAADKAYICISELLEKVQYRLDDDFEKKIEKLKKSAYKFKKSFEICFSSFRSIPERNEEYYPFKDNLRL